MPEIDLEPHEFRSARTRRGAVGELLLSVIGIAVLLFIWWNRAELTRETLFGVTLAFGLPTGGFLMAFLNRFKGV